MKTGYIAFCGHPNAGKSTLINKLIGEYVACVSPKPQTTRKKMVFLFSDEKRQFVLFDTPGYLRQTQNKLDEFLIIQIKEAVKDSDAAVYITDGRNPPEPELIEIFRRKPVLCLLNKTDLLSEKEVSERRNALLSSGFFKEVVSLSALNDSLDVFLEKIGDFLPESDEYLYDPELISLEKERDISEELIRETLYSLSEELPYSSGVRINMMKERSESMIYIDATIYCEKEGQKAIIIGKEGTMIRKLGISAREKLEKFLQCKVFLELRVKVFKNWRKNPGLLSRLGYGK